MIKILKIFFDLGHGGYDTGAVANGIIERDLNLEVAYNCLLFLMPTKM